MTSIEQAKEVLAELFQKTGYTARKLKEEYRNPQVIRILNYHRTPDEELATFRQQLAWYEGRFENINAQKLQEFLKGQLVLKKPGLLISIDDGLLNNYVNAAPLLEKYGFTGWFFVSSGLADGREYMTYEDMKDLISRGHVIGCHTYSHHRMNRADSDEVLQKETVEAQRLLEEKLQTEISYFCWCGGEEDTYTKKASDLIRATYSYGFMTNNALIHPDTDPFQLERTNVEARWPLALAEFQIAGFMDGIYKGKRKRVEILTGRAERNAQ